MAEVKQGSTVGSQYVEGSLYYYAPNKEAPILFAVLFLISFVFHVRQNVRYKSFKITFMHIFCALTMTAGYTLREVGAFHYTTVNIYIASMTIIYSVPPLYEMCNYQILSRLLYYVPYHSPMHPGRILTTLGGISAVVETLNGNGVSYWANIKVSHSKQIMGLDFLKASLVVQLVVLVGFISLTAWFHYKCQRVGPFPKAVRDVIITLYISSVLIGIRALYRTVEYYTVKVFIYKPDMDPSSASPLIKYEAFFWVFEALLMLANSVLWNVRHPMAHLPLDSRVYLAEDGSKEIVGPGYEDLRFFVVAMVDPFDLIGLAMGRHTRKEFWKTDNVEGKDKVLDEEAGTKEEEVEREVETPVDVSGEAEGAARDKVAETVAVMEENGNSAEQVPEEIQESEVEK
ncbi:hypothetical protein L207DRAFT_490473 [Hyaloscypha variabilis F]|uniref:RTA1-domain-containing protein n=1 Tax=Hyaloscypha variabilis (strain UAMH 11265 / GT02V1 / F) TaxID=1149755 RepID=A0A2J6RJT6_HYAVF|nr:hypothetical protein L207DRAFT_490473 [Hyaloscypha variabilis F]